MRIETKRWVWDTLVLSLSVTAMSAILLNDALAGEKMRAPRDEKYVAECGSCHVAFPAKLLPAQSWRSVMSGLPRHFGTDASLDAASQAQILAYLEQYAARTKTRKVKDGPLSAGCAPLASGDAAGVRDRACEAFGERAQSTQAPRITETAWFTREHRKVNASVWSHPSLKSRSNCAACHTQADAGSFREREIRLPK